MTDVDGVPTLVTKTTGPMRAGLVFRVGRADETLATGGITHLVEHLALHRHGVADYHYNGTTGVTTTSFLTQGTPEAVVAFLHGVCASLRDLPTARLATEKKIIETEASGRGRSVTDRLALWRHGARDFGLIGFPEFGTLTLTTEQVADWAATRFTRGNAVLWVAGDDIPAGLRLDLPDGKRWALPAESSALPVTPAYFTADANAVLLDATVTRGAASIAYVQLLERALFRELRHERGLSYTASADYSSDGRPRATVTAVADAQPDNVDAVLDAFLGQLHALRDASVAVEELDAVRALILEQLRAPDVEVNRLPRRAVDLLTGLPRTTTEQLIAEVEALTVDRIRKVARKVDRSALLMVPESVPRPPAGFEAAPTMSRFAVTGKRYRSRNHHGVVLVHGDDGVSVDTSAGPVTVLFEECAALLRFPDGGRHLIGHDAIVVAIEPSLYPVPASALAAVDAAVGAAIVDVPPRDPDSVPKPARRKAFGTSLRSFARSVRIRSARLWSSGRLRWSLFVVLMFGGPAIAFVGALATGRPLIVALSVLGFLAAFRATRRR
jgi:zinc protease